MKRTFLIICVCGLAGLLRAAPGVMDSKSFRQEGSSLRIFSGSVELPARGIWTVAANDGNLVVGPPEEAYRRHDGRLQNKIKLQRKIERGRDPMSSLASVCRRYALKHENRGPASVDALKEHEYLVKSLTRSPWRNARPGKGEPGGPFYFLVPNAEFAFVGKEKTVRRENRTVLAFELRPYVDDGKHWVCYTDGHCARENIDQDLMDRHGQEIRPVFEKAPDLDGSPEAYTYTVLAVLPADAQENTLPVSLTNSYTAQTMAIDWDLSEAEPGDGALLQLLRQYRAGRWYGYLYTSDSPVLRTWLALADKRLMRATRRRRGASTSAMGVMGGFAAVRETLQMQLLRPEQNTGERTIPIDSLEGVNVKSHPYGKMLGDKPGGHIPLAELAPHDHFFVYLSKPEALLPMLDSGAGFASKLGGAITGNGIKYNLKARYLKRLGLNGEWLERFLKSGGVKECALITPDLFFIDGTDITVISRMTNPSLIVPLLKMIGLPALSDQEIVEYANDDGSKVYWTIRDDLLMVGTSKTELQQVLALHVKDGEGSLGKSAEFRYMLTQLAPGGRTRCYAYCSDPFIRRLVGPATKIGQLRRVRAMNQMQMLTSAALLAKMDGFGKIRPPEMLKAKGFLPAAFDESGGYSLDDDLVARSGTYGTLANLVPISHVPVDKVTEAEANAYKTYLQNYSRFWRRFFDPIAFRLNDSENGSLEASMFILPLVDNSIYNGIRRFVMAREDGRPLRVPHFAPDPVLRFSINLNDEAWLWAARRLPELFNGAHINPAILDDLGPGLHLMINDSDPVVALGSGDIMGAFGGNVSALGRNEEMLLIPVALTVLTRPSTIAIETRHPGKTIGYLRRAVALAGGGTSEFRSEFYQVEGRDAWVCMLDLFGTIKLRYGLEVQDGYLLIRNIPWSNQGRISTVEDAGLNGMALSAHPAACKLQLAGLHASAAEKERQAVLKGMGLLYPLLACGDASMGTAFDRHMELFGFAPHCADGDQWMWKNGVIESKRYGSASHNRQPAYAEGTEDFGLLSCIRDLGLQMQFEDAGLRVSITWKTRGK